MEDPRERYYQSLYAKRAERDPEFDRLACETFFQLAYTFEALDRLKSARLREHGLTPPGLNLLILLAEHPEQTARPQDLAPLLLRSAANITGLVDSLEHKGFVERVDCASDRRCRLVRLKPEMNAVLDDILKPFFQENARIARALSDQELRTLQSLLGKLRENL